MALFFLLLGPTTVKGSLSGLPPGNHALIIHTYGNIGNDWVSTGMRGPLTMSISILYTK